jgi:predicted ATPase/DNA-binding CsgD family transcriptional regulator
MVATASRRVDALPADTSRLIGRRPETTAIRQLLSLARLVTLTGVGGVGKTRLAVNVARQLRPAFPGGTFVVPLAELATPELLPTAVMSRLSRTGAASAGLDELAEHIGDRDLLVVLDNCEHLAADCAALVGELLRRCPALRVLATSRERLRVDGEAVYAVPPLSLPGDNQRVVAADLARYDALVLFVDRASLLQPDLTLGDSDAEAIATLCRRLDGLPLAIELMAGRTASFSIAALLARQDDQLRLLTSGSRSAPQRHQTLRATLDYSYELCSEPARRLWARLAVFAGGATLDAVLHVGATDSDDVEQALSELVDKSILTFGRSRYSMLETIRGYGIERLRATGEEAAARQSHCDYFAGLVAAAGAPTSGERTALQQLRAEHANLRAVLEFCLDDMDHLDLGLSLAAGLWPFWAGCGLVREGRHWLGELLSRQRRGGTPRLGGLWVDGFLAALDGDQSAARRRAGDCTELAGILADRGAIAHATVVRGAAELFDDELEEAVQDLTTAVALERQLPSPNPILTTSLIALGIACCFAGQYAPAIAAVDEASRLSAANGEELQHSWSMLWSGLVMLLDGRQDEAVTLLKEVLQQNRFIGDTQGTSGAVEFLAWSALERDHNERAAVLLGISVMLAEPTVTHLAGSRRLARWHEARVAELTHRIGAGAFRRAFERGRAMHADEGVAFALEQAWRSPQPGALDDDLLPLTTREREVAQLVARGRSNKEIAAQLVIAERTAETHVEHILSKLGFTSRTQVVALLAQQAGPS